MYTKYYNLKEIPFNVTPDPKFLFFSRRYKDAIAHLVYGVTQRKGFICITGEVGCGKTTLCRALLEELGQWPTKSAYIFSPCYDGPGLIKAILRDFGVRTRKEQLVDLMDQLNNFLLKQLKNNINVVLIIDEAQNLSVEALETIRLISNLETASSKLIQILLVGQPELLDTLNLTEMRQLNQRIAVRYHLQPMEKTEVGEYIHHRLAVAGDEGAIVFTQEAIESIWRYSRGVPRKINLVCDKSLMRGFMEETHKITSSVVAKAVVEIDGHRGRARALSLNLFFVGRRFRLIGSMAAAACVAALGLVGFVRYGAWTNSSSSKDFFGSEDPYEIRSNEFAEVGQDAYEERTEGRPVLKSGGAKNAASAQTIQAYAANDAFNILLNHFWRRQLSRVPSGLPRDGEAFFVGAARGAGLGAYDIDSNWQRIRAINLPCLLTLRASAGQRAYLPILALKRDSVVSVDGSGEKVEYNLKTIQSLWTGEVTVFYEDDYFETRLFASGSSGAGVELLQSDLKRLGFYSDVVTGQYDRATLEAVKKIQEAHGLMVDGVAGRETRSLIYRLSPRCGIAPLTAS